MSSGAIVRVYVYCGQTIMHLTQMYDFCYILARGSALGS